MGSHATRLLVGLGRPYPRSQLLLLQPFKYEFDRVMKATEEAGDDDYDMDILNDLYKDSAMVLPHRTYDLITLEFREDDHQNSLQDIQQEWDPDAVLKEVKYFHFSDWPLPKVCKSSTLSNSRSLPLAQPWLAQAAEIEKYQPRCGPATSSNQTQTCRSQELWLQTYERFRQRRKVSL